MINKVGIAKVMDEIGNIIKDCRTKENLNQKQLSELSGVSEISIRKYENGDRKPKYDTLVKIFSVLGMQYLVEYCTAFSEKGDENGRNCETLLKE